MRHGKQTAAFLLTAAMVMGSSPAVVFAEDLQSGAEQEAAATGALAESELTSGEQESTEQTGEAVLPEDNLLSAGSAQEEPEKEIPQDKAESGITEIPIISEWQGETEELWSWVYVEQEQKFTLDEAYAEVLKNHEIKWNWEPAEAQSESAVQLKPSADGVSCTATGVEGHAGEKGRLVVEVFDEAGKQTGSAASGQIEVREPSYQYDLQQFMPVKACWEGDVPLRMVCIPEDANHPYGTEEIPLEIVDIKIDNEHLLEVENWENGYVHVSSSSALGWSTTMRLTYKRLDNILETHFFEVYLFGKQNFGKLVSRGNVSPLGPIVKPGATINVEASVGYWNYAPDGSDPTIEHFPDFYAEWTILEGEDAIKIEQDKENKASIYLTANEDADGREVKLEARIMHLNEEGKAEEIEIRDDMEVTIQIDKRPYRRLIWDSTGKGKYYYYVDYKVDTEYEGIIIDDYGPITILKMVLLQTEINGLHFVTEGYKERMSDEKVFSNTFFFFKNGRVDEEFEGLTEYNGAKFYVKDGVVAKDMNGLHLVSGTDDETTTDDKFYFFSNGQIQSEYKGLALYDNEWFYLENGYLDTNTNGIVEHDGGKFIVAVGRIAKEANGLWQDPKDKKWYFASNGQIQTQHTGVAGYDGKLFYVIKGELATDYKGTIKYNGVVYEVINGQLYKKK